MKYALVGYGRMGRAIEHEAAQRGHARCSIFDEADARGGRLPGPDALCGAEVAFEFTTPDAAPANVAALVAAGVGVVCGTTGWSPDDRLLDAARRSAAGVVIAPNFSVGMAIFYRLVAQAGRLFGAAGLHEPFVWEAHHRAKRDAPSGTARRLASILLETDPRLRGVHEGGLDGPLAPGLLQVACVRAGAEPGTHVVGFDGPTDRIALEHRARGRVGFALGAVLAAEWIAGRSGLHAFEDLVDEFVASGAAGAGGAP